MLSTMGTALGTTQGSCFPSILTPFLTPSLLIIFCLILIEDTGLNPVVKIKSFPLDIPPCIPPE